MTKYYRRGQREYYSVSPERVIRIINKEYQSEVTISEKRGGVMSAMAMGYIESDALEGQEITREEFKAQFEIASRLIVLEP